MRLFGVSRGSVALLAGTGLILSTFSPLGVFAVGLGKLDRYLACGRVWGCLSCRAEVARFVLGCGGLGGGRDCRGAGCLSIACTRCLELRVCLDLYQKLPVTIVLTFFVHLQADHATA